VVKVLDGDSLLIRQNKKVYEVRLYGIDTPEYRQAYSNKAKQMTKRLTRGATVTVTPRDVDRYNRIVALVESRGKLVNQELVRGGMAWVYNRYCTDTAVCSDFKRFEEQAKKAGRGLWRDQNPVPPWTWKRQHRK
jgi:endonuclease YncB( thermonuclease family)